MVYQGWLVVGGGIWKVFVLVIAEVTVVAWWAEDAVDISSSSDILEEGTCFLALSRIASSRESMSTLLCVEGSLMVMRCACCAKLLFSMEEDWDNRVLMLSISAWSWSRLVERALQNFAGSSNSMLVNAAVVDAAVLSDDTVVLEGEDIAPGIKSVKLLELLRCSLPLKCNWRCCCCCCCSSVSSWINEVIKDRRFGKDSVVGGGEVVKSWMGDSWNEERRLSIVGAGVGISSGCVVVASKEATEDTLFRLL